MDTPTKAPQDRGQRFASVCHELLQLAREGVEARTGSPAIAHELLLELAAGETALEFVVTLSAESARILGIEHRVVGGQQETRGVVDVNLTHADSSAAGPSWLQ